MRWGKPFLLAPVRAIFYLLVVVHELGHCGAGFLLGFPVQGIEIGPFPHAVFKFGKFAVHLGKFPRSGRTLLGFTSKSYPRWRQLCFLSGGLLIELVLFFFLFSWGRRSVWMEIPFALFFLEELWVNLVPKFEDGLAANDGALLLEVLHPKKAFEKKMRSEN